MSKTRSRIATFIHGRQNRTVGTFQRGSRRPDPLKRGFIHPAPAETAPTRWRDSWPLCWLVPQDEDEEMVKINDSDEAYGHDVHIRGIGHRRVIAMKFGGRSRTNDVYKSRSHDRAKEPIKATRRAVAYAA